MIDTPSNPNDGEISSRVQNLVRDFDQPREHDEASMSMINMLTSETKLNDAEIKTLINILKRNNTNNSDLSHIEVISKINKALCGEAMNNKGNTPNNIDNEQPISEELLDKYIRIIIVDGNPFSVLDALESSHSSRFKHEQIANLMRVLHSNSCYKNWVLQAVKLPIIQQKYPNLLPEQTKKITHNNTALPKTPSLLPLQHRCAILHRLRHMLHRD